MLFVTSKEIGLGGSVVIVKGYGLDGPGIESRCGRDFPYPSRPALGLTQPPVHRVPGLSGGIKRPESGVHNPTNLAPRLEKEYSYTSTPPLGLRGPL